MKIEFEGLTINITDPIKQKKIKSFLNKFIKNGNVPGTKKHFTPEEDARIASYVHEGYSHKTIGDMMDRNHTSVLSRIKRLGLEKTKEYTI